MAAAKRIQQTVNEKRLFHGTSPDAVEAICKQNFDWRLHGKNATVYGEGSYFAKNASYSHAYAKKDVNSSQFMFLALVLVGSYTTGHSSYRRPPPKKPSDPASDLYDSCVDSQSNPTIFVVFDTDQFYPEYLIEYSTVSQTTSATAHNLPQLRSAPVKQKPTTAKPNAGILRQPATSLNLVGTSSNPSGSAAAQSGDSSTTVNRRANTHQKPTTPKPNAGILRQPATSLNLVGTSSNPSGSAAAQSGNSSTTVNQRANTHLPNSTRLVSTTPSSASVLRSGLPATVLSTTAPRSSTSSGTAPSQSRSTRSTAQSNNYSTTVNRRANTHLPNSTRLVSTTSSSASVLRTVHPVTVLSASAPRSSTSLGTAYSQNKSSGSAAQSGNSSTTVNPRGYLPNSTRLVSTTPSSAPVLRSGHSATVLTTTAPRPSTSAGTTSTQRIVTGQSSYYHNTAFDSNYVVLPSSASQSAAQNASPARVSNTPHTTLSNSRSSTAPSIPSSTSLHGSFKDTSANVSPQKKKEKCVIS